MTKKHVLSILVLSLLITATDITAQRTDRQLVALVEQKGHDIVIADRHTRQVVWKWNVKETDIPAKHYRWFSHPSEIKPVYNGQYILMAASGGAAALIRLSDKKVMFYVYAGVNPHSAEILPDGNLVTASSTDNRLCIFAVDTVLRTAEPAACYTLEFAHNVVWDRKRKKLYSASGSDLWSYEYNFDRRSPALIGPKKLCSVPDPDSHDLFPVYREDKLYWTTEHVIWEYDVRRNRVKKAFPLDRIKSISNGPQDYPVLLLRPTESWWSDCLTGTDGQPVFCYDKGRIYKGRWMIDNRFSYPRKHRIGYK